MLLLMNRSPQKSFVYFYSFGRVTNLKQIVFLLNDLEICILALV